MSSENAIGPHKIVLGTYSSHEAAQHAVDLLAEHKFPVEHVTIVGTGLKWEERILGRWTFGRALLTGAGTGAWIGLLIGLIFWIVTPWVVGAVISGVILGLVFGAIFSAVAFLMQKKAYMSMPSVVADRYDIMVDAEFADEARRLLSAVLSTPERSP
jgi:heat induced stress protein YflT